jgi:ribosomal protein S27AE
MTITPNAEIDMRSILTNAGARDCSKCGQLASLPAHDNHEKWFCFECGHEEKEQSDVLGPSSDEQ